MHRQGKIILPVLIVLIVIALAIAGVLFNLYQKEHAQNIQLQEQLTTLGERQRATESKLEDTKKSASELALKLQEAKSKVNSLTDELTQEKSALSEASSKLEQLNLDLQQQKSLRQDLEDRLKTAADEGKQIKDQIKVIQQQKSELEDKVKKLEVVSEGVELGKVVVNGEVAVIDNTVKGKAKAAKDKANLASAKQADNAGKKITVPAGPEGKIMIVNKEFNFAVINLGSRDNVSLGDEFSISREGKYIGDLKIEKVHEAMSAAGFIPELKDLIKENDKITPKAK